MLENAISVTIGGVSYVCPPMPFYCLERAWPHIQKMSQMGAANATLARAQLQVRNAVSPEQHAQATRNVEAAQALVTAEGADFIGQTREALSVIVAALALDPNPPSYDTLSKRVMQNELAGIHIACSELMDSSGLVQAGTKAGEAMATEQAMPALLNGTGLSPN